MRGSNTASPHFLLCWIRFHDLRHTVGYHLAVRGVPLHIIQDVLGHADPKTTRIYTDRTATDEARAVLRLELRFDEGRPARPDE
jgi:integrase